MEDYPCWNVPHSRVEYFSGAQTQPGVAIKMRGSSHSQILCPKRLSYMRRCLMGKGLRGGYRDHGVSGHVRLACANALLELS